MAGPKFVTGADEKYFYMAGILLESLKQFAPDVPLYVMDFGLSEGQKRLLDAEGILLPMPAGLAPGMHPYKLKSNVDRFVGGVVGPWIWIDSDMFAVRECGAEILSRFDDFRRNGIRLAMTRDMGPDPTVGDFSRRYATPKLMPRLLADASLGAAPYLNAGIVFFPDDALLGDWRTLSAELELDTCWEQNALNVIAHSAGAGLGILDARIWNVHSRLLEEVTAGPAGLQCGGRPVIFLHCTSPAPGHLAEFSFPLMLDGVATSGYARMFTQPELRQRQLDFLMRFVQSHPTLRMP